MSQPIIINEIENRLKLSGGTLTGSLYINNGYAYVAGNADESIFLSRRNFNDEKYSRYISISSKESVAIDNSITFVERNNDVWKTYKLYGEHNKPSAADVGAPTLTGVGASGLWDISISGAANKLQGLQRLTTTDEANNFLEDNVVKWAKVNADPMEGNDGLLMSFGWSSIYGAQMWLDDGANEGGMKIRNRKGEEGWHPWRKVITDLSLNDTLGGYIKKRDKGVYTNLGDYYAGGQTKPYIRIALPSDGSFWNMMILEITIRQLYSSGHFGKLYIYGHCYPAQDWTCFNAVYDGTLSSSIKVYGSDKKYIYVAGVSAWGGLSVDRMLLGDAAYSTDLSNVVIDGVDTLPSTYQTASMYKSWRQGDSITTPIGTDYTTKRARNVGANTSLSTPGNGEVWLVYT